MSDVSKSLYGFDPDKPGSGFWSRSDEIRVSTQLTTLDALMRSALTAYDNIDSDTNGWVKALHELRKAVK